MVEAYQKNPEAFIRYIEQQESETGIKRPESIGYIIKYADVELERADRAKLQFEFTNSKITEEYINNNIKHPTVKKEAESLKGQCHSCCGDIAALKSELADLKSGGGDSRVDRLLQKISQNVNYKSLRAVLKKEGYKL